MPISRKSAEASPVDGARAGALTPQLIREQLEAILQSREFARSDYLCRFLRCCVEQTLGGNVAQLKEFWLGVSVFGREESFNPSTDPIVRVQARRLREKLRRYYATEGQQAPFQIVLPVGSYVPHFLGGEQQSNMLITRTSPVSMAVLPLIDLEQTEEGRHFADVLASELVHHLVESRRVMVVSRISSRRFRDAAEDVRAVGRALNAAFVAEGSIWKAGSEQRLTVQLTEAATGYHLCSALFACGTPGDPERVAREAAEALVRTIESRAGALAERPVAKILAAAS